MSAPDPLATQIAEGFLLWIFGGASAPLVVPTGKPIYTQIAKDALPFSNRFVEHLRAVKGDPEYIWSEPKTDAEEFLEIALLRQLAKVIQPWLFVGSSPRAAGTLEMIARDYFGDPSNLKTVEIYALDGRLPVKRLPLRTLLEAAILADLTVKGDLTAMGEAVRSLSRSLRKIAPGMLQSSFRQR